VAALGECGHAVNQRVYKVRLDGTAICSKGSERLSDSEMARQAIEIAQNGLEIHLGAKFLSQPTRREKVARKRSQAIEIIGRRNFVRARWKASD
jgi:hypothetical protein